MKVRELIEGLQGYNPDADVLLIQRVDYRNKRSLSQFTGIELCGKDVALIYTIPDHEIKKQEIK